MTERRTAILDAAAKVIVERGYDAATIADIREASGASTGSIYHAFKNKEGIAFALAARALTAWQQTVAAAQRSDTPEGLIRATVEGLVHWGLSDRTGFAVLDRLRGLTAREGGKPLFELLDRGRLESAQTLKAMVAENALRDLDESLLQALILGPAFEFLRAPFSQPTDVCPDSVIVLSDAAWAAVAPRCGHTNN